MTSQSWPKTHLFPILSQISRFSKFFPKMNISNFKPLRSHFTLSDVTDSIVPFKVYQMTLIPSFPHFEPEAFSLYNHILATTPFKCLHALSLFWPNLLECTKSVQIIREDPCLKLPKPKDTKSPKVKEAKTTSRKRK